MCVWPFLFIKHRMNEPDFETTWLEGMISVQAAIEAGNRSITAVYVRQSGGQRHQHRLQTVQRLAKKHQIACHLVDENFIAAHAEGNSHGGVVAEVGPRQFVSLDSLIAVGDKRPLVVMLDGIEDPFNFGQAIRALYAAGVSGLVVRPRNWMSATAIVSRASAGTAEYIPTAVAETAEAAAAHFRAHGLRIACLAKDSAVSIYDADLTQPLFVLIGGEKRGVTRSFARQADLRLRIPYQQAFDYSLGTTTSTAVFAFERLRQMAASDPAF